MAIVSKGITLSYKSAQGADFVELANLLEIPELGGDRDSIETTVLSSEAHTYTDGLKNYGDTLSFKLLYDTAEFEALNALTGTVSWKVELPDATTCEFSGSAGVKLDGVGINAVLTYTLNIRPNSEMIWG